MNLPQEQPLPKDESAEAALLGAMIHRPNRIVEVAAIVTRGDFFDPANGQLFDCLVLSHQAGEPLNDPYVLKRNMLDMGVHWDAVRLAGIMEAVPTGAHVKHYAETVRELSNRRRIIVFSREALRLAHDRRERLDEITAHARKCIELIELGSVTNMPTAASEAMQQLADNLAEPAATTSGIPTGFPTIDEAFGTIQRSELTTIGARPGGGKTTFSMQLAMHNANRNRRVLYCSLEMGLAEFTKRLACLELELEPRSIRDGKVPPNVQSSVQQLAIEWSADEHPFRIWAPPSATDVEIESRARFVHATHGLDMLVVDHLQILTCANRKLERYQALGAMTMRLKSLAKELGIAVVVQTQLRRSEDRPALSAIRESGDVEQNSDNVWMLHREPGEPTVTEFIVAKYRHGHTGTIDLHFNDGKFFDPALQ